jgi:hypothetical protein
VNVIAYKGDHVAAHEEIKVIMKSGAVRNVMAEDREPA